MFGALLLRTNKLYPIAIIHALIDFFSELETLEISENEVQSVIHEQTSVSAAILVLIILLPFLIFGMWQAKKVKMNEIEGKS